ncbi:hypothetical protein F2P81_017704 [Scophthalmus maximus]|uniref:Interleukin-1 receptor accessory protein n=1 Tax=Scophthalmus maximus TaxID=52904 RepID=A0A6A4S9P9_SCOMX|nr:hypothetical protein F2P81_017704 [Scophthalmus maximus]
MCDTALKLRCFTQIHRSTPTPRAFFLPCRCPHVFLSDVTRHGVLHLHPPLPRHHSSSVPSADSSRLSKDRERLWLQPAVVEDSGQYICMLCNKSSCSKISMRLTVMRREESVADSDCPPLVAVATSYEEIPLEGGGILDCPDLQDVTKMADNSPFLPKEPSILLPSTNQLFTVKQGEEVRLLCRGLFPHLKSLWEIWWTVDGKTPDKLPDHQRFSKINRQVKCDHGDRTEESVLVIQDLVSEDLNREFNCSVKNDRGFETRRAQLKEEVSLPSLELGCGLAVTLVLMLLLFVVYHVFWLELLLLYRSWFGSDERHTAITDETLSFVARSRRLLVVVSPGYASKGSQALLELKAGIDGMALSGDLRVILVQYKPVRWQGWVRELRRARVALALVRWQGDKSRELTSRFWKRLRVELPVRRVSRRGVEEAEGEGNSKELMRLHSQNSTNSQTGLISSTDKDPKKVLNCPA